MKLMEAIGNANANKIYEFNVMTPWQKPNAKVTKYSTRSNMKKAN